MTAIPARVTQVRVDAVAGDPAVREAPSRTRPVVGRPLRGECSQAPTRPAPAARRELRIGPLSGPALSCIFVNASGA